MVVKMVNGVTNNINFGYHTYEKEGQKMDPNVAAKFLINGTDRTTLIEAVCAKDEAIISVFKNKVELNKNERLKLIGSIKNKQLTIDLISDDIFSMEERLLLLSKNLSSNFAFAYISHVNKLTDKEEKYLIKCFENNRQKANDLFRFGGHEKFSKNAIDQIKQSMFKDINEARKYIRYKPNANDRNEAFQSILNTAQSAFLFLSEGKETKAERRQLLKKLALSRTYLPKIVGSLKIYTTNHDNMLMAQTIYEASDLHQADIMLKNCYDKNVQHLLEPLKMAITLIKKG